MMSDNWPPKHMALSTARDYLQTIVKDEERKGDHKVAFFEFEMQKAADGMGAGYHPNLVTDRKMAAKLVQRIHHDLGY
jgi:hypothetical protein